MKRPLLLLTLLAMSSSLFAAGAVPGFHTDYDTALAEAKKLDKPLYIHFTTDWCSWCRKIENDIYKKAKGKAALKPFVAVSLNCTEGEPKVAAYKTLMKKYGMGGYPALVMITPDETLLSKFSGYVKMPEFKVELAKALTNRKKITEFKAYEAKADTASTEFLNKAMTFYFDMGDSAKSLTYANALVKADPKGEDKNAKALALRTYILYRTAKTPKDSKAKLAKLKTRDAKNEYGFLGMACTNEIDQTFRKAYDQTTRKLDAEVVKATLPKIDELLKLPNLSNRFQVLNMKRIAATSVENITAQIEALEGMKAVRPDLASKIDPMVKALKAKQAPAKK